MRVEVESNGTAMPDSALTAFLQLVALRLSKQRALISLIDEDHQVRMSTLDTDVLATSMSAYKRLICPVFHRRGN